MDDRHRHWFHNNRLYLIKHLEINERFLAAQPKALQENHLSEIKAEKTTEEKISKYIAILVRRGEGAFEEFQKALEETDQDSIIKHLGCSLIDLSKEESFPAQQSEAHSSSKEHGTRSTEMHSTEVSSSGQEASSGDQELMNSQVVEEAVSSLTQASSSSPSKSSEGSAEAWMFDSQQPDVQLMENLDKIKEMIRKNEAYDLRCYGGRRRARVICINMENFSGDGYRSGNAADVAAIKRLCEDPLLNLDFQDYPNLTAQEVRDTLKIESQRPELENTAAVFVFALSHGKQGAILDSLGEKVAINELYEAFEVEKCSKMSNKPKAIFVQACQDLDDKTGKVKQDSSPGLSDLDKKAGRGFEDVFLFICTFPGKVAYRHPQEGSYFIRAVCATIRRYAHEKHLLDMFTKVCNTINKHGHECRHVPTVCATPQKDFFLCPGM